jgi:hypothetical protein
MKKTWLAVCTLVVITACGSESETTGTTEAERSCTLAGKQVDCAVSDGLDALRKGINTLAHFSSDSISVAHLLSDHQAFLDQHKSTIEALKADEALAGEFAALIGEYDARMVAADSLKAKQDVMKDIAVVSMANAKSVSLLEGEQKHPVIRLTNKSKKTFHTATLRFTILDREKNTLKDLTHVINTEKFEPAAFGAVFPRYFNGENRGLDLVPFLTENQIQAWDSTAVELINITW